ncbi:centromere protein U [Xyrauchen texanus]|uniref:centromere protein U n=1 Tax=Xyrauchen texanus TaxID=154827 RepID=UPI002241B806|nr:centromere protein U [Xyrauchen texanus]
MSRMRKTLKAVQKELKSAKETNGVVESPQALDISSIEKASFFQGDQYSDYGNPLHSTALEEDLSPGAEQRQKSVPAKTARQHVVETQKTVGHSGVTHNKEKARNIPKALKKTDALKENHKPSQPTNQGAKSTERNVKGRPLPTISEDREDANKKKTAVSATVVSKKAGKGQRSAEDTPEETHRQQRSSSSEELTDEDESFHPSKEKSKSVKGKLQSTSSQQHSGHKQKRKSSSESSERAGPSKKPRDLRNPIDLDVVLDAFQDFVTQYKQSVNSDAVKHAIDAFSRSFEEQLSEMITSTKELKNLKRENAKLNSAINRKRTRLVEANNEVIKGKMQLRTLQKDHDELEQRLKAFREGTSFLTNLQELNRKYLKHRTAYPDEVETYGPSCMAAMLLESRCIMGTEHQLKTINDQLQQVLDEAQN